MSPPLATAWQPQQINTAIITPLSTLTTLTLTNIYPLLFIWFPLFHSYSFYILNQNHSFSLSNILFFQISVLLGPDVSGDVFSVSFAQLWMLYAVLCPSLIGCEIPGCLPASWAYPRSLHTPSRKLLVVLERNTTPQVPRPVACKTHKCKVNFCHVVTG